MVSLSVKNIRMMAIFIFLLDVIVLVMVLIFLWTMANMDDIKSCEKLCLPCKDNKKQTCCGCHVNLLQSFLTEGFNNTLQREKEQTKKEVLKMPNMEKYWDVSWNMKPTAHLSGSRLQISDADRTKVRGTIKEWNKDGNNCFLQNGIEYRNGRLVVPRRGVYHIYSFLDLYQEYDDNSRMPANSISMSVYKSNILRPNEDMVIETMRPYEKSTNNRYMVHESYLGGDIPLEAGDEIYVKLSNLTYVKNPSRNLFGIHML